MSALDFANLYRHREVVELLQKNDAKSVQETIYPEKERVPGVLRYFYDNVGMILYPKYTMIDKKYALMSELHL
jgi:hypothetical protein